MRILFVITGASYGGVSKHTQYLLKYGNKIGVNTALVSAPEPRLFESARKYGAETYPNPYFTHNITPVNDLRSFGPVYQAIRSFSPDIVAAHCTKAGFISRFWASRLNVPVIFTAHGWGFRESRSWWTAPVIRELEKRAGSVTDRIICVSKRDRETALANQITTPEKVSVIYNGIDPAPFRKAIERNNRRTTGESVRIIFVGRLAPPKCFSPLLKAMSSLPEAELQIVGDGPLKTELSERIQNRNLKDRVQILGERRDVSRLLAQADIFVLSSEKEGLPLSIIEAMFSELPVVSSDVGGVSELVIDGKTGILTSSNTSKAFRTSLERMISNPKLRRKMGNAGRKRAMDKFHVNDMVQKTYRLYRNVLMKQY